MNSEKRATRQLLREQRRRLSPERVQAAGEAVFAQLRGFGAYRQATAVVAYVACENEIPTASVLDDVVRSGRPLFLPRQTDNGCLVRWRAGAPLAVGRHGVLEPADGGPEETGAGTVALLPVVAWNDGGMRLGRGDGFYDRLFATLPAAIRRIGLAYEFQECPWLVREAWDIPLHYVITERRIVTCGRGATAAEASFRKGGLQA